MRTYIKYRKQMRVWTQIVGREAFENIFIPKRQLWQNPKAGYESIQTYQGRYQHFASLFIFLLARFCCFFLIYGYTDA